MTDAHPDSAPADAPASGRRRIRQAVPTRLRDRAARELHRFRYGGRDALLWALRLTAAAVASYVVARGTLAVDTPLLAPLTALLVVQATPVSLLASGVDRVVSVVAGVLLAVAVAEAGPLTWWSLGVVIAVSILIGQALRLRANLIEVPISAMLVLGVRANDVAAYDRVLETLVGAGVGVLANLMFPPRVGTGSAADAIKNIAAQISGLLRRAAEEIVEADGHGERIAGAAVDWLGEARRITHQMPEAGAALLHAEEGRRLNVRALRSPNAGPGLRQGLEAIEHSAVAIRSMFRGIHDATHDHGWPDGDEGLAVATDLVEVLRALAGGVEAFGEMVRAEATSRELSAPEQMDRVAGALAGMQEAVDLLHDRLTVDAGPLVQEAYNDVLRQVRRVARELDLEARARRQDLLRPPPRPTLRRPTRRPSRRRMARPDA